MMFDCAIRKIWSHIALESVSEPLGANERNSAETDSLRRGRGSSAGTIARYEGKRVIQAFADPQTTRNVAEIPKNSLADFVSAAPSTGPTWEVCSDVAALMSCTDARITATMAWPDIKDWMIEGPNREATAITDVCR